MYVCMYICMYVWVRFVRTMNVWVDWCGLECESLWTSTKMVKVLLLILFYFWEVTQNKEAQPGGTCLSVCPAAWAEQPSKTDKMFPVLKRDKLARYVFSVPDGQSIYPSWICFKAWDTHLINDHVNYSKIITKTREGQCILFLLFLRKTCRKRLIEYCAMQESHYWIATKLSEAGPFSFDTLW